MTAGFYKKRAQLLKLCSKIIAVNSSCGALVYLIVRCRIREDYGRTVIFLLKLSGYDTGKTFMKSRNLNDDDLLFLESVARLKHFNGIFHALLAYALAAFIQLYKV